MHRSKQRKWKCRLTCPIPSSYLLSCTCTLSPALTGDTPIIGAGTYANDETCAVSATGKGEEFMRHVAAYDVSARVEIGQ